MFWILIISIRGLEINSYNWYFCRNQLFMYLCPSVGMIQKLNVSPPYAPLCVWLYFKNWYCASFCVHSKSFHEEDKFSSGCPPRNHVIEFLAFYKPVVSIISHLHTTGVILDIVKEEKSTAFLGARAPLGIARVKNNNNRTKKFQIAITCSLLFLLATKSEIVKDSQK